MNTLIKAQTDRQSLFTLANDMHDQRWVKTVEYYYVSLVVVTEVTSINGSSYIRDGIPTSRKDFVNWTKNNQPDCTIKHFQHGSCHYNSNNTLIVVKTDKIRLTIKKGE